MALVTLAHAPEAHHMTDISTESMPEKKTKPRRIANLSASNLGSDDSCEASSEALSAVVAACQQGERTGQRRFYELCHQRVHRVAVRMVGHQEAADVTQQVFLQAFRSIGQFNGRSRVETWLYRLTVNESLQFLRRNRRWQFAGLDWEPIDRSHHGGDAERRDALEQALARLDPELRMIFVLREVEELSYLDIAEALQIPEGTVGSRLTRARRELKHLLSGFGFEAE